MGRQKDEKGAVTLLVALVMPVLLGVASLALDLGMQRVSVRDMQALSDMVALDMARQLNGRTAGVISSETSWTTGLDESVARNADTVGATPSVSFELGRLEAGLFVAVPDTEVPSAVKITAASTVDYLLQSGDGAVTRSAVAEAVKSACFSVGSYAARFRSGDSTLIQSLVGPMNGFLRPQANLDAVSYQGLAVAAVSLNEIAADPNVGTPTELLTGQVTVDRLVRATIGALQRQNPQNTVAISALDKVLNGHASLSTPILLSDALKISPTDSAALDTRLNVLDLITGAILVADGEHAINVPNLSAGTGNLSPVSASLKLIERTRIACGLAGSPEAVAKTAQLKGDVLMKLQLPSISGVTGIQGVVHTPESSVRLVVDLANAEGALVSPGPVCRKGTAEAPDELTVAVRSGLATLRADTTLRFSGKVTIPVFSLLGVQIGTETVEVTFEQLATANLPMPDTTTPANVRVPPNDDVPVSVGSSAPLGNFTVAGTAHIVVAKIGGVTVTDPVTLGLVSTALAPVSTQLSTNASITSPLSSLAASVNELLTPYRRLLGLNISGADVLAIGRPTCSGSGLRG